MLQASTSKRKSVADTKSLEAANSIVSHFKSLDRIVSFYRDISDCSVRAGISAEIHGLPIESGSGQLKPVAEAIVNTMHGLNVIFDSIVSPWTKQIDRPAEAIAENICFEEIVDAMDNLQHYMLSGYALNYKDCVIDGSNAAQYYSDVCFLLALANELAEVKNAA